jgi:hypothetical protein
MDYMQINLIRLEISVGSWKLGQHTSHTSTHDFAFATYSSCVSDQPRPS